MGRKVIDIKNLSFTYLDNIVALRDVSLEVEEDDIFGIIGRGGVGKTTLLLHMNGMLITNNAVRVLGMVLNRKNLPAVRRKVSIALQNPDDGFFCSTIFDEVAFGPINQRLSEVVVKERVEKALAAVGLSGYENRSPFFLSFSEKKRLQLAVVLACEPEILLLDEPTSNLDADSRETIINCILQAKGAKVIATHDIDMVYRICNKVLLLSGGRVVGVSDTRTMLENEKLLKMHGLQPPRSLKKLAPKRKDGTSNTI